MRKEFAKALRDQFAKKIEAEFTDFEPYPEKSMYLFPGERAYYRAVDDQLWLFIVCSPDSKGHERFTIELGWSTLERFPEIGMRPNCAASSSREEFVKPEAMLRLDGLGQIPEWWAIEETADPFELSNLRLEKMARKVSAAEARGLVTPRLQEAFEALKSYGIPYLDERVAWNA